MNHVFKSIEYFLDFDATDSRLSFIQLYALKKLSFPCEVAVLFGPNALIANVVQGMAVATEKKDHEFVHFVCTDGGDTSDSRSATRVEHPCSNCVR